MRVCVRNVTFYERLFGELAKTNYLNQLAAN